MWKLLLDLKPAEIVALLDLSYLEDVLTPDDALAILVEQYASRPQRENLLATGYEGYDTSVGWIQYDDQRVASNAQRALDAGFRAFKLKVGSPDAIADIRRAQLLRHIVGDDARVMVDANQQWSVPKAIAICRMLAAISPYWIEEPTHPDDILGHRQIAAEIAPLSIALGEHVPNRVIFKNYLETGCIRFLQPDACASAVSVSS